MNAPLFARPLSVQEPEDWPFLPRRCPTLPSAFDHHDRDTVCAWINQLKPIETSDIKTIEDSMWHQLKRNGHQYQGGRQILAVDGEAALGKTEAVTTALLRVHDVLIQDAPIPALPEAQVRHCPVVYIADQGASFPRLVKAIARFVQSALPLKSSTSADEVLEHLARLLPNLGTKLIVIDDAHMLRRIGAGRDLTDNLKRAVDRLPVSFVFVGAGLQKSALFKTSGEPGEYSAATQLARRIKNIQLTPLTTEKQQPAWNNRVNNLVTEIEKVPSWDWSVLRDHTFRQNLFTISKGSTGLTFYLVKETMTTAISKGETPTADHLLAVARGIAP
ncbi:type II secretory pathway predicted ATPase ExeA [Dietzia sp. 2505]|uniref:ATP-binding protein n=1 Tax=Dietzia sp. 2505 TaxID=3156457 RepID=UPI0033948644